MMARPDITNIKSSCLGPSTLPRISPHKLCADYIDGFCRRGHSCLKNHDICAIESSDPETPSTFSAANYLSLDPRASAPDQVDFEVDGPGHLSKRGPRHDNDHVDIRHIKILPTTDEILCRRAPYMPEKSEHSKHHLPLGQERLLDVNFRHLRYESIEPLIDACYHASQQLYHKMDEPQPMDYDDRVNTVRKLQYSLFRDVQFEDTIFHHRKGVIVRVSFACPSGLRGVRMGCSNHLEDGMLVALVGLDQSLSITFMEVHQRQTTEAMRRRTGNDLRASVILSFAEPNNVEVVRNILHNAHGALMEKFSLVEIPSLLYAGFHWTLQQLQRQSSSDEDLAFISMIAPSVPGTSPHVSPPKYANDDFAFQLDCLRKSRYTNNQSPLILRPSEFASDQQHLGQLIDTIHQETTLDRGQAVALCENLCRGLAFTQGPPGTGKTFLGVSLTKTLLASRNTVSKKPILIVCLTNHALDSFLEGLRDAGIRKFARVGSSSLCTEGISWCSSLDNEGLSWPAVREYLKATSPNTLDGFTGVEKANDTTISDIRLARRAGGFAFEYWSSGGDLTDIERLLWHFNTVLGKDPFFAKEDDQDSVVHQRVLSSIKCNAEATVHASRDSDIWNLSLREREELMQQWKNSIDTSATLDRTAEIHRRHQIAVGKKTKAQREIDARVLAECDVIGMTTTACARTWSMLRQLDLQIVLCEEAGEVMEAQSLCTLFPSLKHLISIGDPLQLRPQVSQPALSLETAAGAAYRLDESLMERMMLPSMPGIQPIPASHLNLQRRMHPEIADLMRATLYPYLEDHESTHDHATVAGMADRIWWLDHQVLEDILDGQSTNANSSSNAYEIEMVAGLVEYLIGSNEYEYQDITVLTPYNGQLAAFHDRLRNTCPLWLSEKDNEALLTEGLLQSEDLQSGAATEVEISSMLKLATIDNFQGEESKVVILSTVRSNFEGRVGFLKTPNRINVGCSRARDGFYIVGNATLMSNVDMWHVIIEDLSSRQKIGSAFRICCPRHPQQIHHVQDPHQWHSIPKCPAACGYMFDCGHPCSMACHAQALHARVGCTEPCTKRHERCGHSCTKLCGQPCGDCTQEVSFINMDCHHHASFTCAEINEGKTKDDIKCNIKVDTRTLPCGHEQDVVCATQNYYPACLEDCGQLLICGHQCQRRCDTCKINGSHSLCEALCRRKLKCGHECTSRCHNGSCPPCQLPCQISCKHGSCARVCSKICDPCVRSCDWACDHRGSCTTICCLPCNRLPCSEPCPRVLSCGHLCPSLCGEQCAARCIQCGRGDILMYSLMFLPCGHQFEVEKLDRHVGIESLYEINSSGCILSVSPQSTARLSHINATCPACGKSLKDVRRYALCGQLKALDGSMDRIYAKFSRKINMFLEQAYAGKVNLDASFENFGKAIRPGPLNGRANELLIRERINTLTKVQINITNFRDDVVKRFELAAASLARWLKAQVCTLSELNLGFGLRFDVLFHRCRLIILEESVKIIKYLSELTETSQHTTLLIEGLRLLTIPQAQQHISELRVRTIECQGKSLVRLEAELHLIQSCFEIVLRDLTLEKRFNGVEENLRKVRELCQVYPSTAGLLLPAYHNIRRLTLTSSYQLVGKTIYNRELTSVWWSWPKHKVGDLRQCRRGHPYSGISQSDCPECGIAVPKPDAIDPTRLLKNSEFVIAIKTPPLSFDGSSYRASHGEKESGGCVTNGR